MTDFDDRLAPELAAAAFRRLIEHLQSRPDVQNIDLMRVAGFCRNCLAEWVSEASAERGEAINRETARRLIYGMPYDEWKKAHLGPPSPEQMERMEQSVARNPSSKDR